MANEKEYSILPTRSSIEKTKDENKPKHLLFKSYVIVSMTLIWASFTLVVRFTRSTTPKDLLYFSTTVVLMAETVKFTVSMVMLLRSVKFNCQDMQHLLKVEFFGKPLELLKMSVPSIAYAVQNNLDFVALSNLEAGVYQVTTQLKVVTTAIFMVIMLRRRYSLRRWFAIVLLFGGVAAVQLDAVKTAEVNTEILTTTVAAGPTAAAAGGGQNLAKQNYFLGLTAVLSTCITAGFAGVYFEKMLKDGGSTPFWIRNLQMYVCGMISASIGCFLSEGSNIQQKGFFYGYDFKVCSIVGLLGIGGIYISLVMKYLDNLHKSFASAFSIILVAIASWALFASHIGPFFVLGSATVCFAVTLYNSVPE